MRSGGSSDSVPRVVEADMDDVVESEPHAVSNAAAKAAPQYLLIVNI